MKGLLEVLQKLFSALFTSTPPTQPDPSDKDKDVKKESTTDEVWSDSAEITQDTIVVTDKEMPFEIEPGKVTDVEDDKAEEEK